jgi:ATP/maltotriose-dependent transcriptional regulator MalT
MVSDSPGLSTSARALGGSELFVGRNDELALISAFAERARSGRPGVMWIEGEAGSGKTALARQALSALSGRSQLVRAAGDEYTRSASFALAEQLAPVQTHTPFAAGLELLEHLTRPELGDPVVVLVEDLHWADADSRRALLTMAQRLDEDRLFLLITSRPDTENDEWQQFRLDAERCAQISLRSFTVEEVAQLVTRSGLSLAPRNIARLHDHTDGHPLYVRTLLWELTRSQLESPDELPAPRSLASTTTATLARLPQPARDLACALSVLNQAVPLSLVGQVAGLDDPSLALEQLLPTGLATWHPREPQTPVELTHPLFRAAIYDDLSPTTRRRLHLAAAEVSDDATALFHRVSAADSSDDALADQLASPGDEVASRLPIATRVQYLLWSSSLTSDRTRREARLIEATQALLTDRQVSRSLTQRTQIEHSAGSPRRSLVLGMMDWVEGEQEHAEKHFHAASTIDAARADPSAAAYALIRLAAMWNYRLEPTEAIEAAQQGLELAGSDEDLRREATATLAVATGILYRARRGLEVLAQQFSAPAARAGFLDADFLVTRGMLGFYDAQLAAPTEDLRRAITLARQGARVAQLPRAHVHLCQLLFKAGDWDDAQVHARLALSLIADNPHVWEEAQVLAASSLVPAARGQWESAEARIEAARQAAEQSGTPENHLAVRLAEALLARARGRWDDVCVALAPLIGDSHLRQVTGPLNYWTGYVEALAATGNLEEARHQLASFDAEAEAEAEGGLTARGMGYFVALAALAAAEGRSADVTAAFEAAFGTSDDNDPVLDRALLYHAFGRHLHGIGDRAGALRSLRSALELLEPLGALPFLERAEADLASWGVRVDEDRSHATLELTEREQSVAALVGRGLTNREVAAELYVSQKAVEYHLSNIYGKLGIRSRQGLRNHPALMLEAVGV